METLLSSKNWKPKTTNAQFLVYSDMKTKCQSSDKKVSGILTCSSTVTKSMLLFLNLTEPKKTSSISAYMSIFKQLVASAVGRDPSL